MHIEIEHDRAAWAALQAARERVRRTDPLTGETQMMQEWQYRQAPSVGARARAILRTSMHSDSFMALAEHALSLYLSDEQNSDRRGFWRPRQSNAPQVLKGVRRFG
jgi:hypothetical protein